MSYGINFSDGLAPISEGFTSFNLIYHGRGIDDIFTFMGSRLRVNRISIKSKTPPVVFGLAWDLNKSKSYAPFMSEFSNGVWTYYFLKSDSMDSYFYVFSNDMPAAKSEYGIKVFNSQGSEIFNSDVVTASVIGAGAIDRKNPSEVKFRFNFSDDIHGKRIALNSCGGYFTPLYVHPHTIGLMSSFYISSDSSLNIENITVFGMQGDVSGKLGSQFGHRGVGGIYLAAIDVTSIKMRD
ncbi:hypothetical protein J7624_09525 [Wohlfahrtiimonas chitiniclastica]|uniref:hypothetical protein n=1 Tax=Wohlfahrtiimonas chitiniclastica TaxID=400946 RepID=UPI001BCFDB8C|nr:hypothetical protein [Wohlfahrtiimonas chitiniclastica]MBS7827381.1 hypothetical protein [Wohlfahrtiimonas chitiniclastica]